MASPIFKVIHSKLTFKDTSLTKFRVSGLSKGTLSAEVPSTTSFPSMVPFSRIFLVKERVSTPVCQHKRCTFK